MSAPLDFTKRSTWEGLTREEACLRIAGYDDKKGLHPGALKVSTDIVNQIQDNDFLVQVFLQCEKSRLRNMNLYLAYQYCEKTYPDQNPLNILILKILECDKGILEAVAKKRAKIEAVS